MAAPPSVVAQVDDNQDESAAAIYARTYNVTLEVAQERLAIQHEIPDLIAKIEEAEPTYAGSWISHTPDFLLFVGFTAADGAAIVQPYLTDIEWAAIVKAQQMPHTVSELLDIQRQVDGTRAEIATDFASATNFQKGKVVLYTAQPGALRRELATKASLQPYLDDIEYADDQTLTTHYAQYKYQTVWYSAADCKEYYRLMDENGNAVGANMFHSCPNSTLPPGSSGEIYSYTAYITGNQLRESMWRGNTGYTRLTPLNNNGTVNWPATHGWLWCCNGTPPQAQGAFVVGNQYNQTVYGSTTDCKRYSRALNNAGQPSGATTVVNCTGQFVPPGLAAGAQMKTYTAFAIAGTLREELWIDGKGYLRNVPLTADNKAVNWNSAPAWNHCCDGAAPLGQGAYIVSRP
jgi:hypothetical protein